MGVPLLMFDFGLLSTRTQRQATRDAGQIAGARCMHVSTYASMSCPVA
jgi:hypothetical protein